MAIRPKGNKWQVDVTWKGVRAPRVSVDTYDEAERIETEFKAQLMAGKMPSAPSQDRKAAVSKNSVATLGQLVSYTVRTHWRGMKSEASAERNASAWADALGEDFPTAQLTRMDVDNVISKWADTVQTGTINRKIAALTVMLKVAEAHNAIAKPFKISQKREYSSRLRWFSPDEIASMEEFFADDRDFLDLALMALDTGFRYGELIKVTPRDYSISTGRLAAWVTKGGDPRSVPLTPRAKEIVMRRRANVHDWEPIFPHTLNSSVVSRRMRAWKAWAKLPSEDEAVFHSFRHTCCSRLVQNKVSLVVVQKWMGHATIQTTMRYAHLAPDAFEDALAALS